MKLRWHRYLHCFTACWHDEGTLEVDIGSQHGKCVLEIHGMHDVLNKQTCCWCGRVRIGHFPSYTY